jgi:hypothetical protein
LVFSFRAERFYVFRFKFKVKYSCKYRVPVLLSTGGKNLFNGRYNKTRHGKAGFVSSYKGTVVSVVNVKNGFLLTLAMWTTKYSSVVPPRLRPPVSRVFDTVEVLDSIEIDCFVTLMTEEPDFPGGAGL